MSISTKSARAPCYWSVPPSASVPSSARPTPSDLLTLAFTPRPLLLLRRTPSSAVVSCLPPTQPPPPPTLSRRPPPPRGVTSPNSSQPSISTTCPTQQRSRSCCTSCTLDTTLRSLTTDRGANMRSRRIARSVSSPGSVALVVPVRPEKQTEQNRADLDGDSSCLLSLARR